MIVSPEDILEFWFEKSIEDREAVTHRIEVWFKPNPAFDTLIRERFLETIERAVAGDLEQWRQTARGSLALILLFDQFPRNVFRGEARAFATDKRAVEITIDGIDRGLDLELQLLERLFFYIPFEHAEDLMLQDRCVTLFQSLFNVAIPALKEPLSQSVSQSEQHREVVRRFGRFPHRNDVLSRVSTDDERAWVEHSDGWGQTTK